MIKSAGRLGFDPVAVMQSGNVNYLLLGLNLIVSFLGGVLAVIVAKRFIKKMDKA